MRLAPGSFPWLVANDVRLSWRRFTDMAAGAGPAKLAALLVVGGVAVHLLAWPVVRWLSPYLQSGEASSSALLALVVCLFSWMIAQSLFGTTRALYDRGDLDLLLGSPLTARRVFAAKAAGITASTFGSIAILTLPVANVGALIDRPAWLGVYPALLGLALVATSLALALSIGLFFVVGARRARTYTQMTGAAIGGAFVLAAQVVAMLPSAMQAEVAAAIDVWIGAGGSSLAGLHRLPIDAIQGSLGAMLVLMLAGLGCFALAVLGLGERFACASLAAVGASSGEAGTRPASARIRFHGGLARNLRRKEWRLLARDPSLFAQLGLQIIYTVPVAVVLLRSQTLPTAMALAPTIVVIAAQVAASLAWLTVSGEDAPELIASAPVRQREVDGAKLKAIALPVLLILALPLAALMLVSWWAALLATTFAAGAGASTALVNFWHPMPGNRRGMLRRHSQSKLIALVEHGIAILWAIAVVIALLESPVAILPVGIVGAILVFFWRHHGRAAHAPGQIAAPANLQPRPAGG